MNLKIMRRYSNEKERTEEKMRHTEDALKIMYSAYLELRKATVLMQNGNDITMNKWIANTKKTFDAASLLSKEQRKRLGFPNFIVLQDDFAKEEN